MKYKQLTIKEREKIQELIWGKKSLREIAGVLGRNVSTISREIKRNELHNYRKYVPRVADDKAHVRRKSRGRKDRLKSELIRCYVQEKLRLRWSPEQISGRILIDLKQKISHEAIYQYIYNQIYRNGYGFTKPQCEDFRIYLRRCRKRRTTKGCRKSQRIFKPNGISIEERLTVINNRKRYGDWESDSVESVNHLPGVNTLLERKSGLYLITKLKKRDSLSTSMSIVKRLNKFPKKLVRSITFDNGSENQNWRFLEDQLHISTYFAHPYSSFERGSNENTNGLLRQYFPKKTNFGTIDDKEIECVEYLINSRPRKRLKYKTPLEVLRVALED